MKPAKQSRKKASAQLLFDSTTTSVVFMQIEIDIDIDADVDVDVEVKMWKKFS